MQLHVKHYTAMPLNNSWDTQVGPVASVPVTTPAQHHFLKDHSFHLLTFFQSVCPEIFHAQTVFKEQSSVSAQTVQLLPRVRSKGKTFCII